MLTRTASSARVVGKYAVVLPIFAALFLAFNTSFAQAQTTTSTAFVPKLVRTSLDTIVTYNPDTYEESMRIVIDSIYESAEVPPVFCTDEAHNSCGDKFLFEYLAKNIAYPSAAREKGVEGTVLVAFELINMGTDFASIWEATVTKSPNTLLSEEALRVVKTMTYWKAGTIP